MHWTSEQCEVVRYRLGDETNSELDSVIQETLVAIEYNGIAHKVMISTPNDLEEYAIGFSFTSGIIQHYQEIIDIQIVRCEQGITLRIQVEESCIQRLNNQQGGLLDVFETARQQLSQLPFHHQYDISQLSLALDELYKRQHLNHKTGASHAAAYVDSSGEMKAVFEDVGRHNALDKLIGFIMRNDLSGGVILVTSRASFEMVQKTVAAGIECLFAISAPTHMGIAFAREHNLTLAGFCRGRRADVYSCPQRITGELSE